jgi:hypothetical protein
MARICLWCGFGKIEMEEGNRQCDVNMAVDEKNIEKYGPEN